MIDEDTVIQKFIDVVRDGVGTQLAQVGPIGSQYGAVIKARQDKEAPAQPYIVIDIEDRSNASKLGINKTVDVTDKISSERLENFLFSFRCYGSDAQRIVNDLHIYLDIDSVRDSIRTDTNGAIRTIEEPVMGSITVGGKFIESSSFNIVWSGENNVIDVNSTIIETIITDLEFL